MIERVSKIGVVGVGAMGAEVAQIFAAAGYSVRLRDFAGAPHGGGAGASKTSLDRLVGPGELTPRDRDAMRQRIAPTAKIETLADCDVIVEAVLERFDLKKAVMRELDAVCRADAILATDTSSISVTRLASTSKFPGRVVGMRFFNPLPTMQVVEIISGLQTTDETTKTIIQLTEKIGKKARVSKDSTASSLTGPRANDQRGGRLRPRRPRLARARRTRRQPSHGPSPPADFVGVDF